MRKSTATVLSYCLLFSAIFSLDRVTKYFMRLAETNYRVNDFLTFTLQYNRGISWGMFDSENQTLFMVITGIISIFIIIFFLYTFIRFMNHNLIFGETMVCAGALSNLIDRIAYGGVADFISLSGSFWSWPVFNVADMFIVAGLAIVALTGYLSHEN